MKTVKKTLDFCAIDFETACNYRSSACAVGLVRVRDGEISDTYFTLIKPPEGMEILPSFTRIHGITNKQVEHAPSFGEAWPAMRDFIGSDLLVAHNCGFDRGVLRGCLEHYGIADTVPEFECTVVCSRRKWPHLENHKLNTVSDFLGIELEHHEALSDAIACARIYIAAHS
jgi:DNA polymerase-3 subunit epsilon